MPFVEKEEEDLDPDQAQCAAGRSLCRDDELDGLDWANPCPAEVVAVVEIVDEGFQLLLCKHHLGSLVTQELLMRGDCELGNSNHGSDPALN